MKIMAAATGTFVLCIFGSSATVHAGFGDAIPGISDALRARFQAGQEAFVDVEDASDGLGPVFNEASCATCHTGPGAAVGGSNGRLETRFGMLTGTVFDPMAVDGGSLRQDHAIGAAAQFLANPSGICLQLVFQPEIVPPDCNVVASRRTTPLFGLGLVDAVPDAAYVALARVEAQLFPSTAGVVSRVTDPDTLKPAVGKFGWKAQVPTLHAFAGDAYLNEMGITNPSFPDENCPHGDCSLLVCNPRPDLNDDGEDVDAFADFMTLLAPPPPPPANTTTLKGGALFAKVGCANCHTPALLTGASAVPALDHVTFFPFSDFLLHDMGGLGDGVTQNQATGKLMRTAPLWGLGAAAATGLLHDGRAPTIAEAIVAHDGQGAASRRAFLALSGDDRRTLLAFLASL